MDAPQCTLDTHKSQRPNSPVFLLQLVDHGLQVVEVLEGGVGRVQVPLPVAHGSVLGHGVDHDELFLLPCSYTNISGLRHEVGLTLISVAPLSAQ